MDQFGRGSLGEFGFEEAGDSFHEAFVFEELVGEDKVVGLKTTEL